jgi:hypothetical protein
MEGMEGYNIIEGGGKVCDQDALLPGGPRCVPG